MTFYVFSRILNLQIHAHIYRSFIRHHKMLGVRIAKRKIEPKKPANPCGTRLCSCIFFVNALQQKALAKASAFCFHLGKGGIDMALENKLGLTSSADLACEKRNTLSSPTE